MGIESGALEDMVVNRAFWAGKKVLVTGHTGFKGSWLCEVLLESGAEVTGLSLAPETSPNLFSLLSLERRMTSHLADIRDIAAVRDVVGASRPEILFHLAAQALVRPGYADPVGTFATNVIGTAHVLDAVREQQQLRAAVIVTTDKVYHNNEWSYPYRETDALGGHDPYSASKACAELVTASYAKSFLSAQHVRLATARAGNVIGGGDWSADRLIPDAVRAWSADVALSVRRPGATRPWQHVLEPVAAYLTLARKLFEGRAPHASYNFGPEPGAAATVRDVIGIASAAFGTGNTKFGTTDEWPHEAGFLALETAQARDAMGIRPRWSLDEAVTRTMDWYRQHREGADALALCTADIAAFDAAA